MSKNREMPDMGWQFKSKEHGGWLDTRYDNLLDLLHNHYEIRQIAAPAEDVRAVVEEHAVWVAESDLSTGTKHAFMATGVPLYRRAQRPLVLPEEFSKRASDDCDEA